MCKDHTVGPIRRFSARKYLNYPYRKNAADIRFAKSLDGRAVHGNRCVDDAGRAYYVDDDWAEVEQ